MGPHLNRQCLCLLFTHNFHDPYSLVGFRLALDLHRWLRVGIFLVRSHGRHRDGRCVSLKYAEPVVRGDRPFPLTTPEQRHIHWADLWDHVKPCNRIIHPFLFLQLLYLHANDVGRQIHAPAKRTIYEHQLASIDISRKRALSRSNSCLHKRDGSVAVIPSLFDMIYLFGELLEFDNSRGEGKVGPKRPNGFIIS